MSSIFNRLKPGPSVSIPLSNGCLGHYKARGKESARHSDAFVSVFPRKILLTLKSI